MMHTALGLEVQEEQKTRNNYRYKIIKNLSYNLEVELFQYPRILV